MGPEIIYPIAIALGLFLFGLLAFRSLSAHTRPYALPTLLAAIVFALILNAEGHKPGYYWSYLIVWFCLGAVVFGVHAHAIRWLVAQRSDGNAP